MQGNPNDSQDTRRLLTPATPEEAALEAAVRALLDADDWTAPMTKHLLDCVLLVRRHGRTELA